MKTLYVKNRSTWRAWLKKHAATSTEIWLIYYRKGSNRPRIPYDDAVEEALCFGWIDSTTKRIDALRFAQRFTPRKPDSQWSASNISRVRKLVRNGKMTSAGLAASRGYRARKTPAHPTVLPSDLAEKFRGMRQAWENFQRFPLFYRRMTIAWVASAKKDETRLRRLDKLIQFSARNMRMKFI